MHFRETAVRADNLEPLVPLGPLVHPDPLDPLERTVNVERL